MSHWIKVTSIRSGSGMSGAHSGVRSDKDYGIGYGGGVRYGKYVKMRGAPKYPDGFSPAPKHKPRRD